MPVGRPINIYQIQKALRPALADIQAIFSEPKAKESFIFLAASVIQDANGMPISIRIDLKSPTDSRVAHSENIMVTPELLDPEQRRMRLNRDVKRLSKTMRGRAIMSRNNRANGLIPFDEMENGNIANAPYEDVARE